MHDDNETAADERGARWRRRERKTRRTMRVHGRGTKRLAHQLTERRRGAGTGTSGTPPASRSPSG